MATGRGNVPTSSADLLGFVPEQQVFRSYADGRGGFVWLRLLATKEWKLFCHTPPICYTGNAWKVEPESTYPIPIGKTPLLMQGFVASLGSSSHLVLYTFLWPDKYRAIDKGVTMVEAVAPIQQDKETALRQLTEFTKLIFADSPAVPGAGLPEIQHRLDANLEGKIALAGYGLSSDIVRAGEMLTVTLYWQAKSAMDENYTVFLRLQDQPAAGPGGRVLAQWDRQPFDEVFPTSRWRVGEVVKEAYELADPTDAAAGSYEIEVGMYLLATWERLRVLDATGQPLGDGIKLPLVQVSKAAP